jgi:Cytochrome P450
MITGPEVILPKCQVRWLLDQPDHVLNQNEVNVQFLRADHTLLDPKITRDGTVHTNVIRREMTKDIDSHAADVLDEIEDALHVNLGSDEEWHEIPVYDTMLDVVCRILNRKLVGLPLCRNQEYLNSNKKFGRLVVITAGLINMIPRVLRPAFAPIITLLDKLHYRKISKFTLPLIRERMQYFQPGLDYKRPDYSQHNDYIQWALHDAFSHENESDRAPEMISQRLTVLSFVALQSQVITMTNTLFDLASTRLSEETQQVIRDEIRHVTSRFAPGREWTKASLAQMVRLDSALRESMRLGGFMTRGVMKMVMVPQGIRLPSGERLSYGTKVGVTAYAAHRDEDTYPDAHTYDAFRFSDPLSRGKECPMAGEAQTKPSMVTTSTDFMGFSHGRHAWYVLSTPPVFSLAF